MERGSILPACRVTYTEKQRHIEYSLCGGLLFEPSSIVDAYV